MPRRAATRTLQKYWHHLLDLVRSGKLDPTIVITHELPLEDAPHAYKIFNDKVTHGSGGAERRAGHAGAWLVCCVV